MATRDRVFLSYAHLDEPWLNRLTRVFAQDLRAHRIDAWSDRLLESGDDWRQKIDRAIDSARVAVLLVSPNFLNSSFIMEQELPRILAAVNDGLTILWIPLEGAFYGVAAPPAVAPITVYQAVCDCVTSGCTNRTASVRRHEVLSRDAHRITSP